MTTPGTNIIKVLVAEANDAIRGRIVKILHWDFQVIGAVSNGTELLRAAVNLGPTAIVSEISLPEMGGLEAWNELKGRGKVIPFVFLSTEADVSAYLGKVRAAYVHKLDIPTNLNSAVRCALAGQDYLSPRCRKS
jgi:DNA-binding NarL/FixJ family response regulator